MYIKPAFSPINRRMYVKPAPDDGIADVRMMNGTQVIMASTAPKINAAAMPCPVRPMTIPVSTMMPEPMICPIASPIQSEIFNFL